MSPPAWIGDLPTLGPGLGYRRALRRDILANADAVGFLEITIEHFIQPSFEQRRELAALRRRFPIVPHGLSLSLGSVEPADDVLLDAIGAVVELVRPPWWSEHVAMTRAGRLDIGHLAPLPFTRQAVDVLCENIRRVKQRLSVPLILENITYTHRFAGAEQSEAEFLRAVVEQADCGLLLDLMNVHANARNHGYDPVTFLDQLPLERVVEVHVVGGHEAGGRVIDSHSSPTPAAVWDLVRYVARRAPIRGLIVEWDADFPPFDSILAELATARRHLGGASCDSPSSRTS